MKKAKVRPIETLTKSDIKKRVSRKVNLYSRDEVIDRLAKYEGWPTERKRIWVPTTESRQLAKITGKKVTRAKSGKMRWRNVAIREKLPKPIREEYPSQVMHARSKPPSHYYTGDMGYLQVRSNLGSAGFTEMGRNLKSISDYNKSEAAAALRSKKKLLRKIGNLIKKEVRKGRSGTGEVDRYKIWKLTESAKIIKKVDIPHLERALAEASKKPKLGKYSTNEMRRRLIDYETAAISKKLIPAKRARKAEMSVRKAEAIRRTKLIASRQARAERKYKSKMKMRRKKRLYPSTVMGIGGVTASTYRRKKRKNK